MWETFVFAAIFLLAGIAFAGLMFTLIYIGGRKAVSDELEERGIRSRVRK